MPILLSLDSSTSVCSAALHEHGELIAHLEHRTPQMAAAQLAPLIEALFRSTGLSKSQLHGVALSAGPGSYTGLRISAATAKGICYGLRVPLISLDSLVVLSASVTTRGDGRWLCPMIDARRMEVYTCLLTEALEVIQPTQPLVVDETSFGEALHQNRIDFFGDGAAKCRSAIRHPNAHFIDGVYPRAADMGKLAFRKFESGDFADARTFEPAYLKEFTVKTKKV